MKNRSGETQEWHEFLPENAGTMACIGGFRLNLIALLPKGKLFALCG